MKKYLNNIPNSPRTTILGLICIGGAVAMLYAPPSHDATTINTLAGLLFTAGLGFLGAKDEKK